MRTSKEQTDGLDPLNVDFSSVKDGTVTSLTGESKRAPNMSMFHAEPGSEGEDRRKDFIVTDPEEQREQRTIYKKKLGL